ncbi:hypothetical protein CDEST_00895 [Colletotrichum destructivum]|uniref:Uncharacterized protein n=1 Tax=Colletotrichum destructivum TaxID=34406 RepID=A0AAX4HYF3_9PEZI|nr:hypothetical protein CDEST_00895 [Colletotrichum destructivum]
MAALVVSNAILPRQVPPLSTSIWTSTQSDGNLITITSIVTIATDTSPSSSPSSTGGSNNTTTPPHSTIPPATTVSLTSPETATTSESAASTKSPNGPPSGISAGSVAGAAIGCLVAGLAIGALVAFFLLRWRLRKNGGRFWRRYEATEPKAFGSLHSGNHGNDDVQLSQFLLDAVPDKEIASELQSLGELIHQHVENHYHLRPVQASPQSLAPSLSSLGLGALSELGTEQIAALSIDPKTRQIALQHVISLVVVASIDFNSRSRFSMLPTPVAGFLQSVPPVEPAGGDKNGKLIQQSPPAITLSLGSPISATSLALSKWRTLSAFLLQPSRSQRTPLSPVESEVSPKAHNLATALNKFVHHFVPMDQGSRCQQLEHLQAVILEFAKLGYEILSQPGDWHFTYGADDADAAGVQPVVVCPGVDKLSRKDGRLYNPARQVVAPLVAQLPYRSR